MKKTQEEWRQFHTEAMAFVQQGRGSVGDIARKQGINTNSFFSACSKLGLPWPGKKFAPKGVSAPAVTTGKFQQFVPLNGNGTHRIELKMGDITLSCASDDVQGLRSAITALRQGGVE